MEDLKPKPITQSRTVRVGTIYFTLGGLLVILQVFDLLKMVLSAVNLDDLPPAYAAWGAVVLALIGAIQVYLRTITSQPIGSPQAEAEEVTEE